MVSLWNTYERALRSLLWRVRAERLQLGVELLLDKAARRIDSGTPPAQALQQVYERARAQVIRQLLRRRASPRGSCAASGSTAAARRVEQLKQLLETTVPVVPEAADPEFQCDAALGGLARWLRAAGYDAAWWPGIDDDHLIEKAGGSTAILLTTDRRLMDRGMIRWGVIAALLIPIDLKKREQLALVASRLGLPRKEARCMSCGGELRRVEKEFVRDRIPPRTYPWRDDYYVCQRCNKLFWEGTHWQRIAPELEKIP